MSLTAQQIHDQLYAIVGSPTGPKDAATAASVKALADQILTLPSGPPAPPPSPVERRTGHERRSFWKGFNN